MSFRTLAFAALVGVAPITASAANLDVDDLMASFNLIALGNFNAVGTDHIEGTAYVGGNYSTNAGVTDANRDDLDEVMVGDVTGSLIVGGDLTVNNVNGAHRGDIVVGGSTATTVPGGVTLTSGVGTNTPGGVPVAEMVSLFTQLSTDLASLSETPGAVLNDADLNILTLSSGAGVNGIAVLTLEEAQAKAVFESAGGFANVDVEDDVTLIVNVKGEEFDIQRSLNQRSDDIVFNFFEATTLDFNAVAFNASVLAPLADLTTGAGGAEGTWIGNNVTANGEIRPFDDERVFDGDLPEFSTPPAPVPLPAGLPLIACALGTLAVLRRRSA